MSTRPDWQKSSFSHADGECVELAITGTAVALRESDAPDVVIATTPRAIGALIRATKAGRFGAPS
ncbi:DUF397 domain-containing protein [Streptomyces sp. XD-27]|uniref:DUF397 domain-containing protein n=1 Tax=Streptomyces sp. XD-27 TaxID=3062779 RepID=UPI0026F466A6|nr:DUF397 domain-containing protein [Streptomyces sp. XD-27]WKX70947.1 DUF397 domain-containing protein [Streptomyces sp. XD-27]